eukprot:COSAG06_NODE_20959_length_775_cov_0.818047_1_plen_122_part_00
MAAWSGWRYLRLHYAPEQRRNRLWNAGVIVQISHSNFLCKLTIRQDRVLETELTQKSLKRPCVMHYNQGCSVGGFPEGVRIVATPVRQPLSVLSSFLLVIPSLSLANHLFHIQTQKRARCG